ncbi:hypothetical protein ACX3VT_02365 [Aerococcus sanguinicola]|uniref:hypothetical protein n=1 Tax=unclassified Aerococcus TaxID=2618060 RepID=UPI0008A52920|nr:MULTISPECIES: hypothetical protein [unclassified Aerococcus]KAB0647299.1 hypothetical protein F6I01_02775 [Aerococcus sanguinicola]MDK6233239.1 hypothetical protein [Aerococcus sp. UMB10185]MDK6856076.1 hypothetical protein [Aerococcus sp. UMB7533]MDK8503038.1 hypothetical protein [Aerococcus sp. UMB1112A]OFN00821.1 hypothetical protein HMPREF2626_08545 [Aerococcus sp. HMSC062A02]
MDKKTKAGLFVLGSLAAVTAVAAVAFFEEDNESTFSNLLDTVGKKGKAHGQDLVDKLPFFSDDSSAGKWKDRASDLYQLVDAFRSDD